MILNKIKYLGLCSAALLTIAPVASNVAFFASKPLSVVRAYDSVDPAYQKSLNDGFNNNVQISTEQVKKLAADAVKGNFASNGNITYKNVDLNDRTTNYLFNSEGMPDVVLSIALKDGLLKMLANPNARVESLAKMHYDVTLQIKGDKVKGATNAADLSNKIKNLVDGDSFFVNLTTTNQSGQVAGTKDINVKVLDRSKMMLQKMTPINVKPGTPTVKSMDEKEEAKSILDSTGVPAFFDANLTSNGFYYGVSGTTHYDLPQKIETYQLKAGEKTTTYNQLIPVSYVDGVADRYANSNFVFLKTDGSGDVDPNGPTKDTKFAYVVQPVIVSNDATSTPVAPTDSAVAVTAFPTTLSANSTTTKSIDPLNGVTATYTDKVGKTQPLTKANIKVTVADSSNKAVTLNADGTVPTTTNGTYTVTYVFTNPDDTTKTLTKTVTLTVSEGTTALPVVNNFVEGTYTLSNVNRKSINPFDAILKTDKIDASYTGQDGKAVKIDNSKVKVAVTDSDNKAVALNTDNTIPLTNTGTYKVTYTFASGDDASKTVSKTVTLNVNSVTVGEITPVYNKDSKQREELPFNPLDVNPSGGLSFSFTYTDPSGNSKEPVTQTVPNGNISVSVTKDGKPVTLNSKGEFPEEIGTFDVTFTVTNPRDNGTVLTYHRYFTFSDPTEPKVTAKKGTLYINYVWGYGVNIRKRAFINSAKELLPNGKPRTLMTGSAWKYSAVATASNGSLWYQIGKDQWIEAKYVSLTPVVKPSAWAITAKKGTGKVTYKAGYSINVWTSPDQKKFTKKIKHGTTWKYFKIAKKGSKTMYNLGGNQWIDGAYFK
ncbi:hypothetical protein [Xylocopilactobacillus apis]|uniref:Uncharacterized protein n=1 Tax=Xylocopilactobacillus apis TaxID=2932183 RepID=A0AAU9DJP0_9LACO|nr:hypothetical protein [Xylocopilactobacillus apis]BDR56997.1 hypothetical protein KIMC2_15590 [Xylocopilactobacillus apis]